MKIIQFIVQLTQFSIASDEAEDGEDEDDEEDYDDCSKEAVGVVESLGVGELWESKAVEFLVGKSVVAADRRRECIVIAEVALGFEGGALFAEIDVLSVV